ncbi:ParA family protein [Methylolobus aquaticus]|nr:ParA family protein [Methylolobus aquaticus]
MITIAVISQKGGAGKTTLAINLAVAATRDGSVGCSLIDLDPQASAATWGDSRSEPLPEVVSAQANRLERHIEAARKAGMAAVVIDTAPHSESAALAAARAADLILIPCRPAILDLHAIGTTIDLARLAGTRAAVVLNAVPPRGSLADEAAEAVAGYQVPLAPVRVTQRAAFVHCLTVGKAIQEFEPRGRGTVEIGGLYRWICETIAA